MAQTMLDSSQASAQKENNSAIIPVPKLENDFYDWYARHDAVIKLIGKQKVDLVFIGDSITHMFGGQPDSNICHGAAVWEKYYSKRNAVNLGFGWDRTQNVLWRLQHGELEGIAPKAAVLLIGTNNLTGTEHARVNTPPEIAAAIEDICKTIQEKAPHCRIILLGVLPRLETKGPKNGFEKPIREINTLLARLDKKEGITFMDLTEKFAGPDRRSPYDGDYNNVQPRFGIYRDWRAETQTIYFDKILFWHAEPSGHPDWAVGMPSFQ